MPTNVAIDNLTVGGKTTPSVREILTASRTYYVRTDGNDNNNGLANTSGEAFLTIQAALTVAAALDCSTYDVTIQVADGTYTLTSTIAVPELTGSGTFTIRGNTSTPSSCIITSSTAGVTLFTFSKAGKWTMEGFKLTNTGAGINHGIIINSTLLTLGVMEFGAITRYGLLLNGLAYVLTSANWTISGSAYGFVTSQRSSAFVASAGAWTISGTPNFSVAFATGYLMGAIQFSNSFSGSATGKRYDVTLNSALSSGGSTLPGDVAGTTATGGQYT